MNLPKITEEEVAKLCNDVAEGIDNRPTRLQLMACINALQGDLCETRSELGRMKSNVKISNALKDIDRMLRRHRKSA
jgi:hypothetical protein